MFVGAGYSKDIVGISYGFGSSHRDSLHYEVGFGKCLECGRLTLVCTTCKAKDFTCDECFKTKPHLTYTSLQAKHYSCF
jgi:hypothetical protein